MDGSSDAPVRGHASLSLNASAQRLLSLSFAHLGLVPVTSCSSQPKLTPIDDGLLVRLTEQERAAVQQARAERDAVRDAVRDVHAAARSAAERAQKGVE